METKISRSDILVEHRRRESDGTRGFICLSCENNGIPAVYHFASAAIMHLDVTHGITPDNVGMNERGDLFKRVRERTTIFTGR